jgi:hypothetical protein
VVIVTLAILVVGGFIVSAFNNTKPPTPTITTGDKKIPTTQGTYCWKGILSGKCVDMIAPPDLVKNKPIVVAPGAELQIDFKKEPIKGSLTATIWKNNDDHEKAKLDGNVLIVPEEKGVYVYDVFARWKRGSSSYAFVVKVQ